VFIDDLESESDLLKLEVIIIKFTDDTKEQKEIIGPEDRENASSAGHTVEMVRKMGNAVQLGKVQSYAYRKEQPPLRVSHEWSGTQRHRGGTGCGSVDHQEPEAFRTVPKSSDKKESGPKPAGAELLLPRPTHIHETI
jgi:hypothetical protein